MKKLVIAEKPSVGREIAKTLNCRVRGEGYIEGDAYIVTWALGHLVELCDPAHYSERWKRWAMKELPMIPETLDQQVIEESSEQYAHIEELLKRKDISSVVIATDAGREGELVARWILKLAGYEGKCERLWISSQTEKAIKEGFDHLVSSACYDDLYHAAECRAAADWYVGMNVTRALTCIHDAKLSAGRVQTPTLALMTRREDEIDAFLGKFYYTARADFGLFSASYYPEENSVRFTDTDKKDELSAFKGKKGKVVSLTSEEREEKAPLAYDLTELQRDANIMLGFSAKETLDTLQKLYEVHKIVTYPRTDSRYLTPDIVPTFKERLAALDDTEFGLVSKEYRTNGFEYEEARLVQEALVTDHHAIIPTEQKVNVAALSPDELKLWKLIAMRFLEVLSPAYRYKTTTAVIDVEGNLFKTRLTLAVKQGWRSVSVALGTRSAAAIIDDSENSFALLRLKEGDEVTVEGIKIRENATTPPERYTDATLLSAMEHAGRFVDDAKLKGHLSGGLGTPATRADMIEKLVQNHYVEREGKYFVPTPKGREVVRLAPDVLSSPELTGEWEARLDDISRGVSDPALFIKDIKSMARNLVHEVETSGKVFAPVFKDAKTCPYCQGQMMKAVDQTGSVHYICQRLSCSYEEKEVKVRVQTGALSEKKLPTYTADGKIKISLKKPGVKVPKAIYETKIEVVRESKKAMRRSSLDERNDRRFKTPMRDTWEAKGESTSSGGTFADFLKQSQERDKKRSKRK